MTVYWNSLGDYVSALDKAGKLLRVTIPVNKDTELHPLVRLQFRGLPESQRKAFLFENVVDSKGRSYKIPVLVGALAGSADIYALGMGCSIEEIPQAWHRALSKPLAPNEVSEGPCHDIVIKGDELARDGLGRLPIPISTPGFDNAPYTTASHWVTRHPDTGVYNLGNYRGMAKAEKRIGGLCSKLGLGLRDHLDRWRAKGEERMPAAIVIGAPPQIAYTAVTRIPNHLCEYDVAGAMMGRPLDVVRTLTQDLLVPAQSDIVIEGSIPTNILEMEGSFGEFPGFMAQRDFSFFMEITAITMRRNPIYLAILSQLPPSESSKMSQIGRRSAGLKLLRDAGFDNVTQVEYPECASSYSVAIVKMKKRTPEEPMEALRLLATKFFGKVAIAVDDDVNAHDVENIIWAIAYRSQPYRDVQIIDVPLFALDPSLVPPGTSRGLAGGKPPRSSALLIDATLPWSYPPLSLPKRPYMERALEIWRDLQLPPLNLKDPWWGYSLGYWTQEEEEEAELAVQGLHYETGEKQRKSRRGFED